MVRVVTSGFGVGTVVGHLQICWYVKYKQDKIQNEEE